MTATQVDEKAGITVWHGEGKTLFYLTFGTDENWEVVATYASLQDAEAALKVMEFIR